VPVLGKVLNTTGDSGRLATRSRSTVRRAGLSWRCLTSSGTTTRTSGHIQRAKIA